MEKTKFNLGICQLKVGYDKVLNLKGAERLLIEAAVEADVLILPELFSFPFNMVNNEKVSQYAESIDDFKTNEEATTMRMLSNIAKTYEKYIIGGSILEKRDDKLFNTCVCLDKEGEIKAKHSKVHLFDIEVKDGITCKESDYISPGNAPTFFTTEFCKIGIGICFDVRFPEYICLLSSDADVKLLCFPSSFNTTTGPMHWDILRKSRALDSQSFFCFCSPAPTEEFGVYPAY